MRRITLAGSFLLTLYGGDLFAFTVQTTTTPAGHEEIIRRAINEAEIKRYLGKFPDAAALFTSSSSAEWKNAGCGSECKRWARNVNVWSMVLGARWVDLRGFRVTGRWKFDEGNVVSVDQAPLDNLRCWEVVTQLHDTVQYDHFLRTRAGAEKGNDGWKVTVSNARRRFKALFENAVTSARNSSQATKAVFDREMSLGKYTVSEGFFLLGRAIHLLQDSFSTEHVTRNGYSEAGSHDITDVKSQVCTEGAKSTEFVKSHAFQNGLSLQYENACVAINEPTANGDIIWTSKSEDSLKNSAKLAVVATRELFAVFVKALEKDVTISPLTKFMNDWFPEPTRESPTVSASESMPDAKCWMTRDDICATKRGDLINARFNTCLNHIEKEDETVGTEILSRPAYDASWSGTIPVTTPDCTPVPKFVNGTVHRHFECPETNAYNDTFWDKVVDIVQFTVKNAGNSWCGQGAEFVVDLIPDLISTILYKKPYREIRASWEENPDWTVGTVAARCLRSGFVGFVSSGCGTLFSSAQLARAAVRNAATHPACIALSVLSLTSAGVLRYAAPICGLAIWIARSASDFVACVEGINKKIANNVARDANEANRLRRVMQMFFLDAVCDTIGGFIWDILWTIASKASKKNPPATVYKRIADLFNRLGDATSLGKKLERFGFKNDIAQKILDNIAGVGGGIQGMIEQGPPDPDTKACSRLKEEIKTIAPTQQATGRR